jgi:enoyl-CoA hydratase
MAVLLSDRPHDGVLVLTMNRPDSRNALDLELCHALHDALVEADGDDAVRAIVLTGNGPAFCAGVDLKAAGAGGADFFAAFTSKDAISKVPRLATPVIGAVNGSAFTGGLELALGCDFLLASTAARFGDTHVRVGVLPGGGLTVRLPQAVGLRRAKELSMTGRVIGAEEAERIGLVNRVVPPEQVLEEALAAAAAVAAVVRADMRTLKQMYDGAAARPVEEALAFEQSVASQVTIDGAEIEARRGAVLAGNRAQVPGVAG